LADIPEYKLKIFVDALQALFDKEPPVSDFADPLGILRSSAMQDDFAVLVEDFPSYDQSDGVSDDIQRDLLEVCRGQTKSRRKTAQKKWNESDAGKASIQASREAWALSDAGKASIQASREAWAQSDAGKVSRQVSRQAWRQSDAGKISKKEWKKSEAGNASRRKNSLMKYLNREIVGVDSEGRAPLHTIDDQGPHRLKRIRLRAAKSI
jgi:hypothetical protein